jgi:DNA-binding protein HU-beta
MAQRIQKREVARRLAAGMNMYEATASQWLDATIDTLYEAFKAGESVTIEGLGGFYVRPERESWVFRFNPGQKLRALFGWSSTYSGEL